MLIELSNAQFGYGTRPVVQVKSLRLHVGRCLGVFGPNGAGKTTLVRGLCGLIAPMRGRVTRDATIRIGYLPQHRAMDLHWPMTALDAASMAVSARKQFGWIGRDAKCVHEAMRTMNVDDLGRCSFARLSGGQQQRILLAGAIASRPQLLVLDEPTGGLDVRSRQTLLESLRAQMGGGLCTVLISHEVEDLLMLADEVAWVRPADDSTKPSEAEIIAPSSLAGRVVKVRWQA